VLRALEEHAMDLLFKTCIASGIPKAAAKNLNVFDLEGIESSFHHSIGREIDRLTAPGTKLADLVNAGPEEDNIWVLGVGAFTFRREAEDKERFEPFGLDS
jgi:hypothetical protein